MDYKYIITVQCISPSSTSWLAKDPYNVLYLQCNMFGYEHIFMAMAKKFNTKIHIARWRMNAYQGIPAVASCLTTDGESTRIHCCRRKVRHMW